MNNPVLDIVNNLSSQDGSYLLSKIEKASEKGYFSQPLCSLIRRFQSSISEEDQDKNGQNQNPHLSKSYKKYINKLKNMNLQYNLQSYSQNYLEMVKNHQNYKSDFEQYINETVIIKQRKIEQYVIGQNGNQQNAQIMQQKNGIINLNQLQDPQEDWSQQQQQETQNNTFTQDNPKKGINETIIHIPNETIASNNQELAQQGKKSSKKQKKIQKNTVSTSICVQKIKDSSNICIESSSSPQNNGHIQSKNNQAASSNQGNNVNLQNIKEIPISQNVGQDIVNQKKQQNNNQIGSYYHKVNAPFKIQRNVQSKVQNNNLIKEDRRHEQVKIRNEQDQGHKIQHQVNEDSGNQIPYIDIQLSQHHQIQNDFQNLKDNITQYDNLQLQFNEYQNQFSRYQNRHYDYHYPPETVYQQPQQMVQNSINYQLSLFKQSVFNQCKLDIENMDLSSLPKELQEEGFQCQILYNEIIKDIYDRNLYSNGLTIEQKIQAYLQKCAFFEEKIKDYTERNLYIFHPQQAGHFYNEVNENRQSQFKQKGRNSMEEQNGKINYKQMVGELEMKMSKMDNYNSIQQNHQFHKFPNFYHGDPIEIQSKQSKKNKDSLPKNTQFLQHYSSQQKYDKLASSQYQQEPYFKANYRADKLVEDFESKEQNKSVTSTGEDIVRKYEKEDKQRKEKIKQMLNPINQKNFIQEANNKIKPETLSSIKDTLNKNFKDIEKIKQTNQNPSNSYQQSYQSQQNHPQVINHNSYKQYPPLLPQQQPQYIQKNPNLQPPYPPLPPHFPQNPHPPLLNAQLQSPHTHNNTFTQPVLPSPLPPPPYPLPTQKLTPQIPPSQFATQSITQPLYQYPPDLQQNYRFQEKQTPPTQNFQNFNNFSQAQIEQQQQDESKQQQNKQQQSWQQQQKFQQLHHQKHNNNSQENHKNNQSRYPSNQQKRNKQIEEIRISESEDSVVEIVDYL